MYRCRHNTQDGTISHFLLSCCRQHISIVNRLLLKFRPLITCINNVAAFVTYSILISSNV